MFAFENDAVCTEQIFYLIHFLEKLLGPKVEWRPKPNGGWEVRKQKTYDPERIWVQQSFIESKSEIPRGRPHMHFPGCFIAKKQKTRLGGGLSKFQTFPGPNGAQKASKCELTGKRDPMADIIGELYRRLCIGNDASAKQTTLPTLQIYDLILWQEKCDITNNNPHHKIRPSILSPQKNVHHFNTSISYDL